MPANDCKACGEAPQNIFADRILQAKQLSVTSSPYGVIKATSCSSHDRSVSAMPEPERDAPKDYMYRCRVSIRAPCRMPTITALVILAIRNFG